MSEVSKFSQFLLDEMKRRDMSARKLAEFFDVSPTTVARAIDTRNPSTPGLDFILKISQATGISVTALIELAYPEVTKATSLSAEAQIIAQQIENLPHDTREVVVSIIRGTKPK